MNVWPSANIPGVVNDENVSKLSGSMVKSSIGGPVVGEGEEPTAVWMKIDVCCDVVGFRVFFIALPDEGCVVSSGSCELRCSIAASDVGVGLRSLGLISGLWMGAVAGEDDGVLKSDEGV